MAKAKITANNLQNLSLTDTVGFIYFSQLPGAEEIEQELRKAKDEGKNQCVIYTDIVALHDAIYDYYDSFSYIEPDHTDVDIAEEKMLCAAKQIEDTWTCEVHGKTMCLKDLVIPLI